MKTKKNSSFDYIIVVYLLLQIKCYRLELQTLNVDKSKLGQGCLGFILYEPNQHFTADFSTSPRS